MNILQDVKYGVRMLAREPGVTAVMVTALALGIGVNTTVFTLVNAVLFRGLPFEKAEQIMYLSANNHPKNRRDIWLSYPELRDMRAQSKTFQAIGGYSPRGFTIGDNAGPPERYQGALLTVNTYALLGQKPLLGRDFLAEEERPGATPVCLIGYSIWENRYARREDILGKTIRVNEVATTIVGVMPKGMKFPMNADMWLPLVPTAEFEKRDSRNVAGFGRLADGATLTQARAEMEGIARRQEEAHPATNKGITAMVIPYNDEFNGGQIRTVFFALLGAVGFVLLIACANVANLLLARSLARAREMSIRAALGASRWRVMRQLLLESVMVGILGGICGLAIARWGVGLFDAAVANTGKPFWIVFDMDFQVFGYLAALCVGSGLVFGLAPAIQLSRADLITTLKEGGRGSSGGGGSRRLSGFLVVSEVALSVVLLAGAGLMIRSFLNTYGITNALDGERYVVMRMNLAESKHKSPASRLALYERLEPLIEATPGVESGAIVSNARLSGYLSWPVEFEGSGPMEDEKRPTTLAVVASPSYFKTARIAVARGRGFNEIDGLKGKESVVVSKRFAAKYWPGEEPIGKRVRLLWDEDRRWHTVVGVSEDVMQAPMPRDAGADVDPLVFVPYRAYPTAQVTVIARAQAPLSLVSALRKQIQSVDPDLAVFGAMTLEENFSQRRWPFRVFGSLFAAFAAIALLLSSVGLYATMAYSVKRRTQEIGVRVAMGASNGSVLRLVLKQGLWRLGLGVAIGLGGAFGLARVLKSLLFRVSPTDLATFATVAGVLLAVGLAACWWPARAAMKVDPTVALRYE
jgi:predicted permease